MGKQSSEVLLLKIDGELKDLDTEYSEESSVEEINSQSEEALNVCRYSCGFEKVDTYLSTRPGKNVGERV